MCRKVRTDGINGKMKAGENIVGGAGLGCVVDWAVLRRNVWGRLYGCDCPRSREDAGCRVGLTASPGTAKWRGFVPLRQRGKGRFRLSVALAPWSAAAFLRYIRQPRGFATRQGKCFTTTRFRGLSVAAHSTKKKAATLSLNVSAQNITTLI